MFRVTNRIYHKGLMNPAAASQIAQAKNQLTYRSMASMMKFARESTPVGATSTLVRSIDGDVNTVGNVSSMRVAWTAPYAAASNSGARPHWVPIRFLFAWAVYKFGNRSAAWGVQKSIAKKGTKAKNFLEKTERKSIVATFRFLDDFISSVGKLLRN